MSDGIMILVPPLKRWVTNKRALNDFNSDFAWFGPNICTKQVPPNTFDEITNKGLAVNNVCIESDLQETSNLKHKYVTSRYM